MKSSTYSGDRYQLLMGEEDTILLFLEAGELGGILMASYYDENQGAWQTTVELTDQSCDVADFSGSMASDGSISILLAARSVAQTDEETVYGSMELVLLEAEQTCDLAISHVAYDEASFVAGASMNFQVELSNEGRSTIGAYVLSIMDESGQVLASYERKDELLPRETLEEYVTYEIPADAVSQELVICVEVVDATDDVRENNSYPLSLSYENIRIEDGGWGMQTARTAGIYADVVNRGYSAQQNLVAALHRDSPDGEVIDSVTIAVLEPLEVASVSFHVDFEANAVYYVTVSGGEQEMSLEDNELLVYLMPEETEELETVASGWSGYTQWALTSDGTITFTGEGAMKNYTYKSEMPWYTYAAQITDVVIEEGVTSIGSYAFSGSTGIDDIYFLGNAPTIGTGAFNKLTATAYYPGGNSTWTSAVRQNYGGSITWMAR